MPKKTPRYECAKRLFKLSAGASRYERSLADFASVWQRSNSGFIGQAGNASSGSTGMIEPRSLIWLGEPTRRWKTRS